MHRVRHGSSVRRRGGDIVFCSIGSGRLTSRFSGSWGTMTSFRRWFCTSDAWAPTERSYARGARSGSPAVPRPRRVPPPVPGRSFVGALGCAVSLFAAVFVRRSLCDDLWCRAAGTVLWPRTGATGGNGSVRRLLHLRRTSTRQDGAPAQRGARFQAVARDARREVDRPQGERDRLCKGAERHLAAAAARVGPPRRDSTRGDGNWIPETESRSMPFSTEYDSGWTRGRTADCCCCWMKPTSFLIRTPGPILRSQPDSRG